MAGYISVLAFLYAISGEKASTVAAATALYPIVSILLSCFILHESIAVIQFFGIFLALCALVLSTL